MTESWRTLAPKYLIREFEAAQPIRLRRMTPTEEAAAAQRRWIIVRLGGSVLFLVADRARIVLAGPLKAGPAGIAVIIIAIVFRIALPFVGDEARQPRPPHDAGSRPPPTPGGTTTARVRSSRDRNRSGLDRDGPYASREDAARAPQIARERAAKWNAED